MSRDSSVSNVKGLGGQNFTLKATFRSLLRHVIWILGRVSYLLSGCKFALATWVINWGSQKMWKFWLYAPAKRSHVMVLIVRVISFLKNGGRTKHLYCSRFMNPRSLLEVLTRLRQQKNILDFVLDNLMTQYFFFCGAAAQIGPMLPHWGF